MVTPQANESFSPKRSFRRILCGICPAGYDTPAGKSDCGDVAPGDLMKQAVGLPLETAGLPRPLAWADMRQAVGLKEGVHNSRKVFKCSRIAGSEEFCHAPLNLF